MDEKTLESLINVIQTFRSQDEYLQPQQLELFLRVARKEGQSMGELQQSLNQSQSSISRNCGWLGPKHRSGDRGLDLLRLEEDPAERRRKVVYLTRKGRQLRDILVNFFR